MGFRNFFKSDKQRQADKAADQIYAMLVTGRKLEVPAVLSPDSDVARAIMALKKKYPETVVTMLQSKSMILTAGNAAKARMANQAWNILDAHGYFPDARLPAEMLFDAHRAFALDRSGVELDVAVAEQKKQDYNDRKIDLSGGEGTFAKPLGGETPTEAQVVEAVKVVTA